MRIASLHRQTGLTLIELLVAVALLAVIASMAYRGLDSMTRGSAHSIAAGEYWQGLAQLFERIASDVAQPVPRPVRTGDDKVPVLAEWWGRQFDSTALDIDPAACQLEFTRKSPSGRDEIRLGYRLHADKVELLIWPALDRAPATVPQVYVLLDGVSTLTFRYLDATGTWQDHWPVVGIKDVLPRAVAVQLTMNDGLKLNRLFALPT